MRWPYIVKGDDHPLSASLLWGDLGRCASAALPPGGADQVGRGAAGDWGRKRKGQVVVLVASHLKERRSMEVHGFSKEINGRWTVNVAAHNSHLFGVMVRLVQRKD